MKIPALVLGFTLLVLAAELLFPFARPKAGKLATRRGRLARMAKNLSLGGLNLAAAPVIVVAITVFAGRHGLQWRPAWLSGWVALGFDLLVLDLWIYAWHRVVHAWSFTWRFHQVHHLDEALDVTSALRFHAGDVLISSVSRGCVILLLGIPLRHVFLFEVSTILFATFHHSNAKLPASVDRVLSRLIVTPSLHWMHHHPVRDVHDSNYATILSVWDRLFGTRSAMARSPDMKLGLEGRSDEGLLGLVVMPFRRSDGGRTPTPARPPTESPPAPAKA